MGRKKMNRSPISENITEDQWEADQEEAVAAPEPVPVVNMEDLYVELGKIINTMPRAENISFSIDRRGPNITITRHSKDILAAEFCSPMDGRYPSCRVFDYDLKYAIRKRGAGIAWDFVNDWA